MFSCEFCETSKNTFFTEHLLTTVSVRPFCVYLKMNKKICNHGVFSKYLAQNEKPKGCWNFWFHENIVQEYITMVKNELRRKNFTGFWIRFQWRGCFFMKIKETVSLIDYTSKKLFWQSIELITFMHLNVRKTHVQQNECFDFIEITLRHGCSPVNLLHISRTLFSRETSVWLLL